MSATVKLPYVRFVRRVSSNASLSKYGYIGIMKENAEALKAAPWRLASTPQDEVTLTTNQLSKTDGVWDTAAGNWATKPTYTAYMDDKYDCFNQAGDARQENATMCGYAGCVAYRFKLPEVPQEERDAQALESVTVSLQRDRYLRSGVRIAMQLSNSETPSANWDTEVRGEGSWCVKSQSTAPAEGVVGVTSFGVLGQPDVSYLTASRADGATVTISTPNFSNFETRRYLYLYLTLEDPAGYWDMYKAHEKRQYYIEGSAMLLDAEFTFQNEPDAESEQTFNVAKDGVYQSLSGAMSGMYGVEVLRNGDDLDEISFTSQAVPAALSSNMVLIAGTSANLRNNYDANVCFSDNLFNLYAFTSLNEWKQEVLVWADAPFWGYDNRGDIASQVLRVIAKDGTNATSPIKMTSMTTEDVDAGVAFAWVEGKLDSTARRVHVITRNGVEIVDDVLPQSQGYWSHYSGSAQSTAVHTRTTGRPIPVCIVGDKPVYLSNNVISGDGLSSTISVVGTITAIRSRPHITPHSNTVTSDTLVISGNLTNVGGVVCKNCAVVTVSGGSATISRPSWDAGITPDVYDGFCVSPVHPLLTSGAGDTTDDGGYVVTGAFAKLSTTSAQGCALLSSSGTITPKPLPGATADLHSVDYLLAISGDRYFYRGRQASQVKVYPATMIQGVSSITAEQSCIALRALYAKLYTGGIKPLTVTAAGSTRHGAGFVVGETSKTVYIVSGSSISSTQVAIYHMSLAATAVPFSVPITFQAKRVKIDWGGWGGIATGGKFNVWMQRGKYSLELPDSTLKKADIYTGSGSSVDGWEYLGSVNATLTGVNKTKTFNLSRPLTSRVATIMLTAFIDMDSVNPDSEMNMPQGVATGFSVDPVSGLIVGADTLWAPDITLIG